MGRKPRSQHDHRLIFEDFKSLPELSWGKEMVMRTPERLKLWITFFDESLT